MRLFILHPEDKDYFLYGRNEELAQAGGYTLYIYTKEAMPDERATRFL